MSTPKISVIIPVYNVEPYIRECLDSVVNQTLRDIEIICVNDGSTDNSGAILAEYAALDERITVITQENGGLSAARNVGMDAAIGGYIYFIDSDDYITLDALDMLYSRAEDLKLDVLFFDFVYYYDGVEPNCRQNLERQEYADIYSGVEYLRTMRDDDAYWITAWSFLISRAFLKKTGIKFCEGIICEDHLFAVLTLLKADRVSHLGRRLYHYRIRPNSITTTPPSQEWIYSYMTIIQEVMLYGLSVDCGLEDAYELWRTVEYFQKCGKAAASFINIGENENIFDKPFTQYLYKHFVLDSMKVDDEYATLRKEIEQMQIQLVAQRGRVETAARKEATAEQSATAAWQEVENIHRSATYRIGRVITWAPRMVRGFVRRYREHGWRYTWRRVAAHLRGR